MAEIRRRSRADRRRERDETPSVERRAPAPRELDVRIKVKSSEHAVVVVGQEFVAHNYYLFEEAMERLTPIQRGFRIEVEMSRVPYADSEALGRLYAWTKKLTQTGARLVVVNPTPYVQSIMELLHLDRVLTVVHRHTFHDEES